jgi:hypothetical protein
MKITKEIFFSIALLTMAVITFAQPSSRKERLLNKQDHQVVYVVADYSPNESSRLESWMHDLSKWAIKRSSKDVYEVPVVTESYVIESADVVYEGEFLIESWMTTSFECGPAEEALDLESWMTEPFEAADHIEVEEWMTKAWI